MIDITEAAETMWEVNLAAQGCAAASCEVPPPPHYTHARTHAHTHIHNDTHCHVHTDQLQRPDIATHSVTDRRLPRAKLDATFFRCTGSV